MLSPVVAFGCPGGGGEAAALGLFGIGAQPFEQRCERRRVFGPKVERGVAGYFAVLRRVVDHQAVAVSHRFDEGGMSAAHLGGVNVNQGVREQLAIAAPVDRPGEAHAYIGGGPERGDEIVGVRGSADHQQGNLAGDAREPFDHAMRVVLRLEA
jgi:hypothetical protein